MTFSELRNVILNDEYVNVHVYVPSNDEFQTIYCSDEGCYIPELLCETYGDNIVGAIDNNGVYMNIYLRN